MSEFTAKVNSNGSVVIPKNVRDLQEIEEDDYVVLVLKEVRKPVKKGA